MARIGINGFGRIGRYLVRLMAERNEFPVVINARADNASLAHLFKYDSVHHTFKGTVGHDENGIIINGTHIAVTRCKPNEWQWKDYGVDLVVESTADIVAIFCLSIGVLLVCHQVKIPPIVGFLLTAASRCSSLLHSGLNRQPRC